MFLMDACSNKVSTEPPIVLMRALTFNSVNPAGCQLVLVD